MKLSDIIYNEEYESSEKIDDIVIESVTTNLSEITPNTLFVIIRSIKFDVNKIINDVIQKSPAAIICDYEIEIPKSDAAILRVRDTRKILPYLFSRLYKVDFSKTTFIAVTGTNGKTSTATMLTHILRYAGKKVGFIGTGKIEIDGTRLTDSKYSMTTPDPNLLYYFIKRMQTEGCEFLIMEVSSHALYFKKVLPIPYEISIFTNLSAEHLDFHKNMENYFKTKLTLFKQTKTGIFNTDDEYSKRAMRECECEKLCIGIINDADAVARDVAISGFSSSEYIYRESGLLFKVKLNIGGAFNVYNSMMAICAAIKLGIKPCIAKAAISTLNSIDGRLEAIHDDVTVIIDYAHTTEALRNILKTIKRGKNNEQNVITVFGCGGERDRLKRPEMAKVAKEYSDFVIVTSDNSRGEPEEKIINDVLKGFDKDDKFSVIIPRKEAIFHAILNAKKNDIIALIGKGHERYNVDKSGIHDFDERSVIADAIKERHDRYENYSNASTDDK